MKNHLLSLLSLCLCPLSSWAYDLPYVGDEQTIKLAYDDTMPYIARDYNLGYVELMAANPDIDPWLPKEGTNVIIPTRHILPDAPREGIVVNLSEMRLYAFITPGAAPKTFPIGIGRDGLETPMGNTEISWKTNLPTWRPTIRMRTEDPSLPKEVGPGINNPLGTHALYLGWPEYLIHGTNRPFGIGRRVSSGCMRMYPEDISQLYELTPVKTNVTVIDQPIKAAWIDNEFYIEAHPSMNQALEFEQKRSFTPEPLTDDQKSYIATMAKTGIDNLNWDTITDIITKRSGRPEKISIPRADEQDTET